MIYVENVFVCLVAPLLISVFLLKGEAKRNNGFFVVGLVCCLLSAYMNSFVIARMGLLSYGSLSADQAAIQLTPVCEELMKALPVIFYMVVFAPDRDQLIASALAVGLGFATLENGCYITLYGASELPFALIRGFSAGIMHAVCAAMLGYGLCFIRSQKQLAYPGAFAILCAATTFHAIYNLLVTIGGSWQTAGYLMPAVAALMLVLVMGRPTSGMGQRGHAE